MQHRRRMIGYAIPEEIAADCLFETQGNVAEGAAPGAPLWKTVFDLLAGNFTAGWIAQQLTELC
jgi:hypothetical protein